MVWGKKLSHAAWPGLVYSAGGDGTGTGHEGQLLVSYFGDKAFAWCDAAELRPYEPYFPVAELYDDGGEDFDAAVEASLDEFSRRVEAALTANARPFLPADFIASLHDLAADRMGFTNRVQAAVAKAHLRAFDTFRALPDPPQYTLELGLGLHPHILPDPKPAGARHTTLSNSSASTPSRRGRKRKEEVVVEDDSDEDWDPRKKGATDSDSDQDFDRRRRGSRGGGAPRGRPRGRPRKNDTPSRDAPRVDMEEEKLEYPSAAQMLLQLLSLAADPVDGDYDSAHVIVSFFSKHKDSEAPSVYQDRELLETFGCKKGRKKSVGSLSPATTSEADTDKEKLVAVDGQRGRRKSAGSLYSARKAEDSYWCDIIISDFDDGDSDYEGRKRKRPSQNTNRSVNKKVKQESPQDPPSDAKNGVPTDPISDAKPVDGPAALILHFSSPEAIPSVDDINSIFRVHGPIMEHETEITKKSKIAKVVFSKRADAERAYSSSGKYSAFGPSLLTYEIKYLPSAPQVS